MNTDGTGKWVVEKTQEKVLDVGLRSLGFSHSPWGKITKISLKSYRS